MAFFINFGKKAGVYYTLNISKGEGGGGPGPQAPLDSELRYEGFVQKGEGLSKCGDLSKK